MLIIEEVFVKFENISGALLSRSWKSKIMGLGKWRNRIEWPLPWLRVETKLKIFGFQIGPTFKITLEKAGLNVMKASTRLSCPGHQDN